MRIVGKVFCLFMLIGCNNESIVQKVSEEYVDFLSKDVKTDFNVFVRELRYEDKRIYRINSGTYNLKQGEIPNLYYEYKDHYIFIFFQDSSSEYSSDFLKWEGFYKKKERAFSDEDYDEWLLLLCSKGNYKLIKDSWYRPFRQFGISTIF